jgi:hypothetical protein
LSYEALKHVTVSAFLDHWGLVKADRLTVGGGGTEVYKIKPWTKADMNVRFGDFDLGDGMTGSVALYVENIADKAVYQANNRGSDPFEYRQAPRNFRVNGEVRF